MDRFRKLKKEKSEKISDTDKQPIFITDVKSIKENLKIKEILRTVKMNSSMRLKAPPGSKVMNNMDFNDEDCFEETSMNQNSSEPFSATNPDVVISTTNEIGYDGNSDISSKDSNEDCEISRKTDIIEDSSCDCDNINIRPPSLVKSTDSIENNWEHNQNASKNSNGNTNENIRDRKLSLDHTNLPRREGFSQSELDLHSIGKSPLERKSSFFKKTMDSFVRNTTEMFRKQNKSVQSRASMSVSLQSLNDKSLRTHDYSEVPIQQVNDIEEDRIDKIQSQIARSNSSLPTVQRQSSEYSPAESFAGSQSALHALSSSNLGNVHSSSVHSLNEAYLKDAMLNSRAISMSSGLDSPFGQPRKKASRFNRVTWVASEGMTNYLRRVIQDEKSKEMQSCQSHQDFSSIPENELYSKPDTKGRRLSYQRAVSGEDPVQPTKSQSSSLKKKQQIQKPSEDHEELANILRNLQRLPIASIEGYEITPLTIDGMLAFDFGKSVQIIENRCSFFKTLPKKEKEKQRVIIELITSEIEHINSLLTMMGIFLGPAQYLQSRGKLREIRTSSLFSNLPELLNASLRFWEVAFVPILIDVITKKRPFNPTLLYDGFRQIGEVLHPYEKFVLDQTKLLEYYRSKQRDVEFSMYLSWCHSQTDCNRLQLNDFLVKPMQRLTKYSLILHNILSNAQKPTEISGLRSLESFVTSYVLTLNDSVKYYDEIDNAQNLGDLIDTYDNELKDDNIERYFKIFLNINMNSPMLYCLPYHHRCLIHVANLRFRDGAKESDARVFLTTDMLLVCKKATKGSRQYKLIRPKYRIDKLVAFPKYVSKNMKDLAGLGYILIDDVGSACGSFLLSEPYKDPNPQATLRLWENKFKEARVTYELLIWAAKNPKRQINDTEMQNLMDSLQLKTRLIEDQGNMEREVRQRVVSVTLRGSSTGYRYDMSQNTPATETTVIVGTSVRLPAPHQLDRICQRTLPAIIACTWRLANVQKYYSSDDIGPSTSQSPITGTKEPLLMIEAPPNIMQAESDGAKDSKTVQIQPVPQPDKMSESSTLQVQPDVNSSPDLNAVAEAAIIPDLTAPSTSKEYGSQQELLQRTPPVDSQSKHPLSPDNRDIGWPPQNPARGVLKRAFEFSQSRRKPPLIRMAHVDSPSPPPEDVVPSTSQQVEGETSDTCKATDGFKASSEKSDKKSKLASRSKLKEKKEKIRKLWPRRNSPQPGTSPQPGKNQESPNLEENSSYLDETIDSSEVFIDESVELLYMDLDSSANRNESGEESPGQRTGSSATTCQVSDIANIVEQISLELKDLRPHSGTEQDYPRFQRADSPDPFAKDTTSPQESDIISSSDNITQKSVTTSTKDQTDEENEGDASKPLIEEDDASFINIRETIIKKESTSNKGKINNLKRDTPECSSSTRKGKYRSVQFRHYYTNLSEEEDTDSISSSHHEVSSLSSDVVNVVDLRFSFPSRKAKSRFIRRLKHFNKRRRFESRKFDFINVWCL